MTTFGQPRRHVVECGSTNDLARAWATAASDPAPHGALVTAAYQTQGRGRRGRQWDAPAAESALMSFVLRPDIPLDRAWQLGYVTALATADALRGMGLESRLKWPNDVLLEGAKVAGVLVETTVAGQGLGAAVAGIGLNVNQAGFESADYAYPPTSLRRATGREHAVEDVVAAVAASLGRWDATYRDEGFAPVLAAWGAFLAAGVPVRRGTESATLSAVLPDGGARVRLADGTFAVWTALE